MSIHWYDSDKRTELDFPLSLGVFSHGEAPNKLIWFYSDETLEGFRMKIEEVEGDPMWKALKIAKDYNTRPQAFIDYLSELYWDIIQANTWVPLWIKFLPEKLPVQEAAFQVNLRLTAETLG